MGHEGGAHLPTDRSSLECCRDEDSSTGGASGQRDPLWNELVQDHYSVQQACYFTEVQKAPGAVYASSRNTDDFIWNHAYLDGLNFLESVPSANAWLSERSRDLTIYVDDPSDSVPDWSNNFQIVDRETWMVVPPTSSSPLENATVVRCVTSSQRLQFAGLVGAIFRPDYEACLARWNRGVDGLCDSVHILLYIDDQAVGTGSLYWRDMALGAIHDVGVLPSHRRQGLGSYVVRALLSIAYQEGIRTCYLQCEESTEGFYAELGFSPVHRRTGLQPRVRAV